MKSILIAAMLLVLPTVASSKEIGMLKLAAITLLSEVDYTEILLELGIKLDSKGPTSGDCSKALSNNPNLSSAEKSKHIKNYKRLMNDALSSRLKPIKALKDKLNVLMIYQAFPAIDNLETDVYPEVDRMKARGENTDIYISKHIENVRSISAQIREVRDEYIEKGSAYLKFTEKSNKIFRKNCAEPGLSHLIN